MLDPQIVHLQILLAVGLAVLCFCLLIGCIFCYYHCKLHPKDDKEAGLSVPPPPVDHVTITLSPSPSIVTQPIKQQYEELDGDVLDFPSINSSSEDDISMTSLPGPQKSRFSLRRLSSPVITCKLGKPAIRGRSSLPTIPKLSLSVKSHSRVDDDSNSENSKIKVYNDRHYGSSRSTPSISFTLLYSSSNSRLTVSVLGVFRGSRRLSGMQVTACLPPLCPETLQAGRKQRRRRSLSAECPAQVFSLQVWSVQELQTCTLRLSISSRDFSGLRETPLGELEMSCADIQWESDHTFSLTRQLNPARRRLRKSQSCQAAVGAPVSLLRSLGQILILLQYQSLAHRIKVMVRKAQNLPKLSRMPGTPDHSVIINLLQDGTLISTKETKCSSGLNPVWNAPFLFDLPAGDVSTLMLEFIIMQGRLYAKSCVLGRVLIGCEGSEAGNQHWREMRNTPQVETACWHLLQQDTP